MPHRTGLHVFLFAIKGKHNLFQTVLLSFKCYHIQDWIDSCCLANGLNPGVSVISAIIEVRITLSLKRTIAGY